MNPITRVLAALLATLAFVGALFFGVIILAVVVGLGLIFWLGLRVRMWWIGRQMPASASPDSVKPAPGEAIEAEYTVVSKQQDP